MVGETMKDTHTLLETVKTSCGNTILFRPDLVGKFFKKNLEENFAKLTPEEKERCYFLAELYDGLDIKIWKQPLHDLLNDMDNELHYAVPDEKRNPIEEYETALAAGKNLWLTDEEHDLYIERLRLHKEWFEKQNQ